MSNTIFPSSFPEASVFLENFAEVAQTHKDEFGLSADQIKTINDTKTKYQADLREKQAVDDLSRSKNAAMRKTHDEASDLVSFFNTILKADKKIARSSIQQLGLTKSAESPASISPVMPKDLVAEGFSNGINKIKWKKGANKPNTQYLVEAKSGAETEFSFAGVTTKSVFEHLDQKPGVRTFYRVKAQRNDEASPYSNEAVVY
jgi:hypothetical protein